MQPLFLYPYSAHKGMEGERHFWTRHIEFQEVCEMSICNREELILTIRSQAAYYVLDVFCLRAKIYSGLKKSSITLKSFLNIADLLCVPQN